MTKYICIQLITFTKHISYILKNNNLQVSNSTNKLQNTLKFLVINITNKQIHPTFILPHIHTKQSHNPYYAGHRV
jgi:hypothetical protein